jgi:hypothetical protein
MEPAFDLPRVKVILASFIEYCSSIDLGKGCPDFFNYLEWKDGEVCAALNIEERIGANKLWSLSLCGHLRQAFQTDIYVSLYGYYSLYSK